MPTSREWLNLLRQNRYNAEWFRPQTELLFHDINKGLNAPSQRSSYMQVLVQTIPLLPMAYRLSHWLELSRNAVTVTYDLKDAGERLKALNALGSFQLFLHAAQDAEVAFSAASELANAMDDRKAQLRALIGYIWLQAQVKSGTFTFQNLPDVLMYNGEDRDNELSAQLYQAVGALCNRLAQPDRAAAFSRFAYSYFKTSQNVPELARTAYTIAVAYRELRQLEVADYYLEQAANLYAKTNYVWQHSGITYERGVQHYLRGEYEAALQWMQMSWQEAQLLDDPHRHQRVQHCLGIVLSRFRNRLDEARAHLGSALNIAEAQGNNYDIAHIRHSLAFTTARQGDYATARNEINYGLGLTAAIPDEGKRKWLREMYEELLEMIESDDPRLRE